MKENTTDCHEARVTDQVSAQHLLYMTINLLIAHKGDKHRVKEFYLKYDHFWKENDVFFIL